MTDVRLERASIGRVARRRTEMARATIVAGAVARHDLRLLRRDPTPLILVVIMPVLLLLALQTTYRFALADAAKAEAQMQPVAGLSVMFAFFATGDVAASFFRDFWWGVWDRLRASETSMVGIIFGKLAVPFALCLFEFTLMFSIGFIVYGIDSRALPWAAVTAIAFSLFVVSAGVATVALTRTLSQAMLVRNLGALLLGALGRATAKS